VVLKKSITPTGRGVDALARVGPAKKSCFEGKIPLTKNSCSYIRQKRSYLSYYAEDLMRLTRAGEYAVRCVLYLSAREEGTVVPRREVAEAMEIPGVFLGKIAQQLARSGILEIIQGARGGFRGDNAPGSSGGFGRRDLPKRLFTQTEVVFEG
jgi:hypothetical protein